jgi:hypothetical protein
LCFRLNIWILFHGTSAASGPRPPHYRVFTITLNTPNSVGLDELSIRRRNLYLATHNAHKRHPCPQLDSKPQYQQASGCRPTRISGCCSLTKLSMGHLDTTNLRTRRDVMLQKKNTKCSLNTPNKCKLTADSEHFPWSALNRHYTIYYLSRSQ